MTLKVHNTLSGITEEFIPGGIKKDRIEDYPPVKMYSCGPTVYNYAHIGNFRTFVFNDLLRRYLKFRGFKVDHAMNITDVDDKTIAGAAKEAISLKEYTEKYSKIFLDDLKSLNIEAVEHVPLATESVDAMIDIIEKLKDKGIAYEKDGSMYFAISRYENYGKLSRLDRREICLGISSDSDEYAKDDARDFALWKAAKENEPYWDTPFGKGRPGWHIECSAMIRKIFGTTIDIHTGGVDLVFPHHENEIAQSEAAYNEKFVRYWLHAEHLFVEGNKMSKSLGNCYTLRDLTDKGSSPRAIRYLLMSAHYKKQMNFTFEGLTQAAQALGRIDNFLVRLNDVKIDSANPETDNIIQTFLDEFAKTVDEDLNISGGLGVFFEFVHKVNALIDSGNIGKQDAEKILDAIKKIDSVFGFIFMQAVGADVDAERIEKLIAERKQARAEKNFKRSDEIRDMLLKEDIILEDSKEGTRWKKK